MERLGARPNRHAVRGAAEGRELALERVQLLAEDETRPRENTLEGGGELVGQLRVLSGEIDEGHGYRLASGARAHGDLSFALIDSNSA